jgi:hypothetical protein
VRKRPELTTFDVLGPQGSVNVPLYRPILGWDIPSNIRRAGFAFFGVFGTGELTQRRMRSCAVKEGA